MKYETKSAEETQKIGFEMGKEALVKFNGDEAAVFALYGDLGSGKTTFTQGFAKGLGISEKILSPTFVIVKEYKIPDTKYPSTSLLSMRVEALESRAGKIRKMYHIDCYRLKDSSDLQELGWQEIISNPQNIILLEWPDRIADIRPKNRINITFETTSETKRQITIQI